jgi:non-homologous end joining protein Ku
MARAIWKGSIAFGLVNIPIELHTAIRSHRPKFRMLHAKDKSPVKFERVCAREGESVAWDDLVKGYEYEKGHFVDSLAAEWDPAKYTDQYRENLLRIIQGKLKGKAVALEPTGEPRQAEVVDLMERLRKSLEQRGGKSRAARSRRTAKKGGPKKRTRHAA